MKTRPALTVIELLVILAVVAIVMSLLLVCKTELGNNSKRAECMMNMRKMCMATNKYMSEGSWKLPMRGGIRQQNDGAIRVFDPKDRTKEPATNDISSPTVDLWLLVRAGLIEPKTFVCPATKDTPDPADDPKKFHDFLSADHLSYAYQNLHDPDIDADKWLIPEVAYGHQYAIMADSNPYVTGKIKRDLLEDRNSRAKGNSRNHAKSRPGQVVGFMDGHADFRTSADTGAPGKPISKKLKSASGRDNIYSFNSKGDQGTLDPGTDKPTSTLCNPGTSSDACLVP